MKKTIFLINNFRFEGEFISEDAQFLIIIDDKTKQKVSIAKSQISTIREDLQK